jgi:STE24 endopeptidase
LHAQDSVAVRRIWLILWILGVGVILLLCFATLADRPFDREALRHFSLQVLHKGRQFSREGRVAITLQSLASLVVMAGLCFHPLGARLLRRLEALGKGRLWLGLVAIVTGVALVTCLVELPFAYYLGYLHEKAYGLTRATPLSWLFDYLIGSGVDLVLSLLLWIPLYEFIRRWPRRWWVPAAILNLVFSGLVTMLYPVLLMPLFNDIVPARDPQVVRMVEHLAERADVQVEKVQEMLVSKKTSRVNAMVTGLGFSKQIIFYDTLLQQFTRNEVEVVLAHELGHAVNRDVFKSWALSVGMTTVTFFLAAWMLEAMVGDKPLSLPAPYAPRGLALLLLFMTLLGQVTDPIQNIISRRMEVRADRFAITITRNPKAFVSGFKKLAQGNPGDVDPPAIVEFLDHSHPSVLNRIKAVTR